MCRSVVGSSARYSLGAAGSDRDDAKQVEHCDEATAETLARNVRKAGGALRTGFLGTRPLLAVLTAYGHADLAYRVASRPEFPEWVYMLKQGATAVWERWDSDSPDHVGGRMNSLNHSSFACVSEWFYEHLAGVDVRFGADAYRVRVAPSFVDDLSWAEGSVETPLGTVASRWEATDGGHEVTVRTPWNAAARVALPVGDADAVSVDGERVWADGAAAGSGEVEAIERSGRRVAVDVGPGRHEFRIE